MAKYLLSDLFEGNYKISQSYGNNPTWRQLGLNPPIGVNPDSYYYSYYGLKGHEGVDWATPVGVWLINPFSSGQIIRTGYDYGYGYYVVIWNKILKCAVWYCHLSSINVSVGQVLSRYARVGKTGQSGNVSGAHLHCNFVETDSFGNRLNINNGYKGYLDIMDKNLVSFSTTPQDPIDKIKAIINTQITDTQFRNEVRAILKV